MKTVNSIRWGFPKTGTSDSSILNFFFQWSGTHGSCILSFFQNQNRRFFTIFKEPPDTGIYPVANCVMFRVRGKWIFFRILLYLGDMLEHVVWGWQFQLNHFCPIDFTTTSGYPRPSVIVKRPCIVLLNSPYFLYFKNVIAWVGPSSFNAN